MLKKLLSRFNKTDERKTKLSKEKIPSKIRMLRRINTLTVEVDKLQDVIKSELYKEFMKKLGEPDEVQKLREEIKRLRLKVKNYKEVSNG